MDSQKKRWAIIVLLAVLIVAGSFYDFWRKSRSPEEAGSSQGVGAGIEVAGYVSGAGGPPDAATGVQSRMVSLNCAGKSELETLPGIGPVIAERIISYRQAKGPFRNIAELKKVPGIGEAKFNRIKERITL